MQKLAHHTIASLLVFSLLVASVPVDGIAVAPSALSISASAMPAIDRSRFEQEALMLALAAGGVHSLHPQAFVVFYHWLQGVALAAPKEFGLGTVIASSLVAVVLSSKGNKTISDIPSRELEPKGQLGVVFRLGGSNVAAEMIDARGSTKNPNYQKEYSWGAIRNRFAAKKDDISLYVDELIYFLAHRALDLLRVQNIPFDRLTTLGVSFAGPVVGGRRVTSTNMAVHFKQRALAFYLTKILHKGGVRLLRQSATMNDGETSVLGENFDENGKLREGNGFYVGWGTGIGAAITKDGKIDPYVGEIGHILLWDGNGYVYRSLKQLKDQGFFNSHSFRLVPGYTYVEHRLGGVWAAIRFLKECKTDELDRLSGWTNISPKKLLRLQRYSEYDISSWAATANVEAIRAINTYVLNSRFNLKTQLARHARDFELSLYQEWGLALGVLHAEFPDRKIVMGGGMAESRRDDSEYTNMLRSVDAADPERVTLSDLDASRESSAFAFLLRESSEKANTDLVIAQRISDFLQSNHPLVYSGLATQRWWRANGEALLLAAGLQTLSLRQAAWYEAQLKRPKYLDLSTDLDRKEVLLRESEMRDRIKLQKTAMPRWEIEQDYEAMSQSAYRKVKDSIQRNIVVKGGATLLFSTGKTPVRLYQLLADGARLGEIDFTRVTIFMQDEYVGSHAFYDEIHTNFLDHLPENNQPEAVFALNGMADDLVAECNRYQKAIRRIGGIDLALLGVGENGHIGFNEPDVSPFDSLTRPVPLSPSTRGVNGVKHERAVTVGILTTLSAREILLIANGQRKAEAIAYLAEGKPILSVPATALMFHDRATVLIDKEAATHLPFYTEEASSEKIGAPLNMLSGLGADFLSWAATHRPLWTVKKAVRVISKIEAVIFGGFLVTLFSTLLVLKFPGVGENLAAWLKTVFGPSLMSEYPSAPLLAVVSFMSAFSWVVFSASHLGDLFAWGRNGKLVTYAWNWRDWLEIVGIGFVIRSSFAALTLGLVWCGTFFHGYAILLPLLTAFVVPTWLEAKFLVYYNLKDPYTARGPLLIPSWIQHSNPLADTPLNEAVRLEIADQDIADLYSGLLATYAKDRKIPLEGFDEPIPVRKVPTLISGILETLNIPTSMSVLEKAEARQELSDAVRALKEKSPRTGIDVGVVDTQLGRQFALVNRLILEGKIGATLTVLIAIRENVKFKLKLLRGPDVREEAGEEIEASPIRNWLGEEVAPPDVDPHYVRFGPNGRIMVWKSTVYFKVKSKDKRYNVTKGLWIPFLSLPKAFRGITKHRPKSIRSSARRLLPYFTELELAHDELDVSAGGSLTEARDLIAGVIAFIEGLSPSSQLKVPELTEARKHLRNALALLESGNADDIRHSRKLVELSGGLFGRRLMQTLPRIIRKTRSGPGRILERLMRDQEFNERIIRRLAESIPKTLTAQKNWLKKLLLYLSLPVLREEPPAEFVSRASLDAARGIIEADAAALRDKSLLLTDALTLTEKVWDNYTKAAGSFVSLASFLGSRGLTIFEERLRWGADALVAPNLKSFVASTKARIQELRSEENYALAGTMEAALKQLVPPTPQQTSFLYIHPAERRLYAAQNILLKVSESLTRTALTATDKKIALSMIAQANDYFADIPVEAFRTDLNLLYPRGSWPDNVVSDLRSRLSESENKRTLKNEIRATLEAIHQDVLRALSQSSDPSSAKPDGDTPGLGPGAASAMESPDAHLANAKELFFKKEFAEAHTEALLAYDGYQAILLRPSGAAYLGDAMIQKMQEKLKETLLLLNKIRLHQELPLGALPASVIDQQLNRHFRRLYKAIGTYLHIYPSYVPGDPDTEDFSYVLQNFFESIFDRYLYIPYSEPGPLFIRKILTRVDSNILPRFRARDYVTAITLPKADDWFVLPLLSKADDMQDLLKKALLLAEICPRGSVLFFGLLGPHLRAGSDKRVDTMDLILSPVLLSGFLPYLKNLLDRQDEGSVDPEVRTYSRLLFNGLLYNLENVDKYRANFDKLMKSVAALGVVDPESILRKAAQAADLFEADEKTPLYLRWRHMEFGSDEIYAIDRYNRTKPAAERISVYDVLSGNPNAKEYLERSNQSYGQKIENLKQIYGFLRDRLASSAQSLPAAQTDTSEVFGYSGIRDQHMPNQTAFRKMYPDLVGLLSDPSHQTFLLQLSQLLRKLPEYQFVKENPNVRYPSYFYDLMERKRARLPLVYFDPRMGYPVVVVEKFLHANATDFRYALSFVSHDYGHVVDENGGIVWKTVESHQQMTVREAALLKTLPRRQRSILSETLFDFRAEIYRHSRFPQTGSDPLADSKYSELMGVPAYVVAISRRRLVKIARAIVMCEWAGDKEKAIKLRTAILEPLKKRRLKSYKTIHELIAFLWDYIRAHEFDPAWMERVVRQAA